MNQIVSTSEQAALADYGISIAGMPMGLAIMFNDKLFDRVKQIAGYMAKADGITPPHLIGKSEACFAVITRAITWKLDPYAVMQSTYQTPGGRVGFEGKLIQAILENSGKLVGPVTYEHFGDWSKINGKFEMKRSQKGNEFPAPTWTRADAKGVGVIVSAQVKGELERRVFKCNLDEMFPLNSTLWATRPSQQICYTACRAFANIAAPGLLMGEPFDVDREAGSQMRDVTPARPARSDFDEPLKATAAPAVQTVTDVEDMPPHDADTGEIAEDQPTPGHPEALELGREHRRTNRARRAPPELAAEYHETYLTGWDDQDAEMQKAGNK